MAPVSSKMIPMDSLRAIISRLARMTSSLGGLDAVLMLAQYSSPFVIALVLKLARYRALYAKNRGYLDLVKTAEGLGKVGASLSEARLIMRLCGVLPVIQGLMALHPDPVRAIRDLLSFRLPNLRSPKTLPTLQTLAIMGYYPLEQIAWLAQKGVIQLSPKATGIAMLLSVRCWAIYVMLELYKLYGQYGPLKTRSRAELMAKPKVTPSEAEGYEMPATGSSNAEKASLPAITDTGVPSSDKLRGDWDVWQTKVLTNLSYAPLTVHWSKIGGIWTNPLITAALGAAAATGSVVTQWRVAKA